MPRISPRLAAQYVLVTGASQGIGRADRHPLRAGRRNRRHQFPRSSCGCRGHAGARAGRLARTRAWRAGPSRDSGQHRRRGEYCKNVRDNPRALVAAGLSRQQCRLPAGAPSEAIDIETYRRIIEVNLTSAVLCAHKALAHFVEPRRRRQHRQLLERPPDHPETRLSRLFHQQRRHGQSGAHAGARIRRPRHSRQRRWARRGRHADQRRLDRRRGQARGRRKPHPARPCRDGGGDRRHLRVSRLAQGELHHRPTIYACGGLTLFGEFRENWAS